MGYMQVQFQIIGAVSRHASERDKEDDADWLELCERLTMIAKEHRYERVVRDISYYID